MQPTPERRSMAPPPGWAWPFPRPGCAHRVAPGQRPSGPAERPWCGGALPLLPACCCLPDRLPRTLGPSRLLGLPHAPLGLGTRAG
eukprot:6777951-Alexandrium_andersonii.AAC.2